MTKELETEWQYRFEERVGILLGGHGDPTPEQDAIARQEADEAVHVLGLEK